MPPVKATVISWWDDHPNTKAKLALLNLDTCIFARLVLAACTAGLCRFYPHVSVWTTKMARNLGSEVEVPEEVVCPKVGRLATYRYDKTFFSGTARVEY